MQVMRYGMREITLSSGHRKETLFQLVYLIERIIVHQPYPDGSAAGFEPQRFHQPDCIVIATPAAYAVAAQILSSCRSRCPIPRKRNGRQPFVQPSRID